MGFDKSRFYKNCKEKIESLSKHICYLGDLRYAVDFYDQEPSIDFDEDEFIANSVIEDSVIELKLSIISATEQLGLTSIRESFLKEFEQYQGKENMIELLPWFDTSFSPVLSLIQKYVTAISIDVEQPKVVITTTQLERTIESIRKLLKNSGFLLNYMKIEPKSEHEIHRPIFAQLKTLYPSAINKYKIHKPNKNYEIDIMVKEEKVGIELKFAKSLVEVNSQIDELYTDMIGYEENDSEQKFIAVLYMDSQYITEDLVRETLKQNNCPINWEVIIVINKIGK